MSNRLLSTLNKCHITLIDSLDSLGGKSCGINWSNKLWSPHPFLMSQKLFDFAQNSISSSPDDVLQPDLEFIPTDLTLLAQKQITRLNNPLNEDSVLAKNLGSSGGAITWKKLIQSEIFEDKEGETQNLAKKIGAKAKDSIEPTLKMICSWNGTSSWQKTSTRAFKERTEYCSSLAYTESLPHIFETLLGKLQEKDFDLLLGEKIFSSEFDKNKWTLKTKNKNFEFDKVVIAHSPWEALHWSSRDKSSKANS